MKLVTGQLKPSKGTLRVLGEPIWQNPALYLRIGFCPEQDAFYERMTGLEWVTALVRLNGVGRASRRSRWRGARWRLVDLSEAADKKIGAYSKGMRQRDQAGAGARPRSRAADSRRAARRHGPAGAAQDDPPDQGVGARRQSVVVSSHILHEIESMTSNILLINQGRILAEGNVHQIRDLIDEHPHTVNVKADEPRALARAFLADDDVLSLKFESEALVVQTGRPDVFYARLTAIAASGELGAIHEVTSPDDNLQAVFEYLVK